MGVGVGSGTVDGVGVGSGVDVGVGVGDAVGGGVGKSGNAEYVIVIADING